MTRIVFAVLWMIGAVTAGPRPSSAEDAVRIGYVDVRKVLNESESGKRHKAEMEKLLKERQDQLGKEEQQLRELQQAYEKNKLTLSDAQKKQKQKEFQEKFRVFHKHRSEAQRELNQKDNDFTRHAIAEVRAIVRTLAREEKLALVFEKNELEGMLVLYAQDGPDLTDKVLARFNASSGKQ